ncbi:uncharacterized protein LOC135924246 [Gordionus sp. m RMFG-2023]|uniref:uncharacterized protein LOC135924246 n=1 Tax=Gordionus sp. m RMFG-2023 TaxID=3053472 RepID=UPI0031FCD059
MDYLASDFSNNINIPIGRAVILPSSFQGSSRNMQERYHDAMSIVLKYDKPDLFITFTCNPTWPEISENLFNGQTLADRPDIVSRVFKIKLAAFLSDITKNNMFGKTLAYVYTIEFQKRGLPHAHLLFIISSEHKIDTAEAIDKFVCAEIPDRTNNSQLFNIVTRFMIHGPCGILNPRSPCMDNGVCTKNFPKDFINDIITNTNGYPLYKRRDVGSILISGKPVYNRFVIPYNTYLLLKYNAHINVEICTSLKSVKYIFKYVYKDYDCANIDLNLESLPPKYDEIKSHLNTRYVSSCEAMWRLLEYPMHDRSHAIIRLALHMPFKQSVYFQQGDEREAFKRANLHKTTLTAWFYLRLLLLHVPGATSFDFLRTVDDILLDTFKETAIKRHLFSDDKEWEHCLEETSLFQMPFQFRLTFAFICIFGQPQNPEYLWDKFKPYLIEDFWHCNNFNLPIPEPILQPKLYDSVTETAKALVMLSSLNSLQKYTFDLIIHAIEDISCTTRYFYLDGPGGSGKTYLYNTLIYYLRGQNKIVLPFATTGISSILLNGGKTIHSGFKLPIPILNTSVSHMRPLSTQAKEIKLAHLIIIDESSMMTKHAIRCIDVLLREIMQIITPFGGKVILLGGDFRQTLPVIPRASKTCIIESCIKSMNLWHIFHQIQLTHKMRTYSEEESYIKWLLQIGEGNTPLLPSPLPSYYVEIPLSMLENSLISSIYGDSLLLNNIDYLSTSIILTTKNDITLTLNNTIISKLPCPLRQYYSSDSFLSDHTDDSLNYPLEFLNSHTFWNSTAHTIIKRLCNGPRLIIKSMHNYFLDAEIITGTNKGYRVFIPRIDLTPSESQ